MNPSNKVNYYSPKKQNVKSFCHNLSGIFRLLNDSNYQKATPSIICIGTDKIIGDCLGPLVGTKLIQKCPDIPVYGTLKNPIHAGNLSSFLDSFYQSHPNSTVIAVDASIGQPDCVGLVTLSSRPLSPGKGVRKNFPSVGNISITGIVEQENPCCEMQLSYTRLYYIDTMAEFISNSLVQFLKTGCTI